MLTNGTKPLEVHLRPQNDRDTMIGGVDLHSGGTGFIGSLSNVHYLFYVSGDHRAKASVGITFPNSPAQATRADIIVGKTPIDTKPGNF